MDRLPLIVSGFTGTAGKFAGIASQILQDRLELLAFEQSLAELKKDTTCFSTKN